MVTLRSFQNGCCILCVFWCLGLDPPANFAQEALDTDVKRDRVLVLCRR